MIKRICSILSTILLLILGGIAIAFIVPKMADYEEFAVISGSMEPELPIGSIVYTKSAVPDNLQVGSIVTYQLTDEMRVTHRITAIDTAAGTVTTKGDANQTADQTPVPFENILGICQFHLPLIGYISIYGRTPLGITGVCVLLIVMLLLSFLPEMIPQVDKPGTRIKRERIARRKAQKSIPEQL